jgi:hypothetical protein
MRASFRAIVRYRPLVQPVSATAPERGPEKRAEWRGYTSQAMLPRKGTPNPSPRPRFHRRTLSGQESFSPPLDPEPKARLPLEQAVRDSVPDPPVCEGLRPSLIPPIVRRMDSRQRM